LREKESHVLLSDLSSYHLSNCGDVTGEYGYFWDVGETNHMHFICHKTQTQTLAWKILASAKLMPKPWAYWESENLAGKHVINLQMAAEMSLFFG